MFDKYKQIHFIGIGGSGISSIAYLALSYGIKVTGSDATKSPITEDLKKEGIKVNIGHKKNNLNKLAELVIYTEAIDQSTNSELLEAKKLNIPTFSYFEAIGEISNYKKTIAVIGTHGKTTTVAMLGQALSEANIDPTVILGSRVPAFNNKNMRIGHSEWLIVEGCEYRQSFMSLNVYGIVLLNCEAEHLDYFKNEENYINTYIKFIKKIPKNGFLIYNQDDYNSRTVSKHCKGKLIPINTKVISELGLKPNMPGDFNKQNATFAFLTGLEIGANEELLRTSLSQFKGVSRRLEILGKPNGIVVISDYAHHPTEIKATLKALKEKYGNKRIVCIYQPHQYARTLSIMEDLPNSFDNADVVIIPNIYEARDSKETMSKINGEKLAKMISKKHNDTRWGHSLERGYKMFKKELKKGDIALIMGAGDVYKIGEWLMSDL